MNFGRLDLWRDRCSARGYEWVVYVWAALAGGVWGGLAVPLAFEFEPNNAVLWLALWPGWLDFQLRSHLSTIGWNPIVESAIIGAVGACLVAYMVLTVSHVRETQ
jgi:hypothetical protein